MTLSIGLEFYTSWPMRKLYKGPISINDCSLPSSRSFIVPWWVLSHFVFLSRSPYTPRQTGLCDQVKNLATLRPCSWLLPSSPIRWEEFNHGLVFFIDFTEVVILSQLLSHWGLTWCKDLIRLTILISWMRMFESRYTSVSEPDRYNVGEIHSDAPVS